MMGSSSGLCYVTLLNPAAVAKPQGLGYRPARPTAIAVVLDVYRMDPAPSPPSLKLAPMVFKAQPRRVAPSSSYYRPLLL